MIVIPILIINTTTIDIIILIIIIIGTIIIIIIINYSYLLSLNLTIIFWEKHLIFVLKRFPALCNQVLAPY